MGCQCCCVRGEGVYQTGSRQDQPRSSPGKRHFLQRAEAMRIRHREEEGGEGDKGVRVWGECRSVGKPLLINVTNIY